MKIKLNPEQSALAASVIESLVLRIIEATGKPVSNSGAAPTLDASANAEVMTLAAFRIAASAFEKYEKDLSGEHWNEFYSAMKTATQFDKDN